MTLSIKYKFSFLIIIKNSVSTSEKKKQDMTKCDQGLHPGTL